MDKSEEESGDTKEDQGEGAGNKEKSGGTEGKDGVESPPA